MQNRIPVLGPLLVVSLLVAGCQTTRTAEQEADYAAAIADATIAVLAYEQNDCVGVANAAEIEEVERWEMSELRHSMLLVHGFCQERAGRIDEARETYRTLVRDAPLSFASDDARERLRILRLVQNDPEYAAWVEAARDRALTGSSTRVPVDRTPADFPPLAHEAGVEGFAVVEFGVTPRGDTDAPVIVDSNPPLLFDGAALRAVRAWRYARDPSGKASERQAIRIVFQATDGNPALDDAPSGPSGGPQGTIQ